MGHQLAARRHAVGQRHDEAAERVDIVGALVLGQDRTHARFEFLDGGARIGQPRAVRTLHQAGAAHHVVLVLDLADHLFDQILDGDQAVDPAELVDHQRDMGARMILASWKVSGSKI